MTLFAADVTGGGPDLEGSAKYRTTHGPCVTCLTTKSLDDAQSALGTVRWQLNAYFGLMRGKAINFHCSQGHSSDADPELLKAFPSRTFDPTTGVTRN